MRDHGGMLLHLRPIVGVVVLAAAYGFMAVLGLQWAEVRGAGSPVWPAAGVALAGLLIGGVGLWPAIVIGRFCAALAVGSGNPVWVEGTIAVGNAVSAVIPALLFQRLPGVNLRFTTMRTVLWFVLLGGLGAGLSAAIGTGALWLSTGMAAERMQAVLSNWWFGAFVGTVTAGPLILVWSRRRNLALPATAWVHLLAGMAATAVLCELVFVDGELPFLRTWWVFPALIWSALAFQVRGAALAALTTAVAATWGATIGTGPFAILADDVSGRVSLAQQFSAVAAVTVLVLAAVADERRGKEALLRSERALAARNRQLEAEIAERRLAEAALASSEGRLRLAQEAGRSGVWEWRPDCGDTFLSDGALRLIAGAEDGAADIAGWPSHVHPEDTERAAARVRAAAETGDAYADEYRVVHGDGSVHWVRATGRLADAPPAGRVMRGVVVDVTELKEAEERLRVLNARLELRVEERTAEREAALRQLHDAQKLEAIGRLTGGVAHDFNNLLMAIRSSVDLLARRLPREDGEARRLLDIASASVERGADLTRRMLVFARRQELSPDRVAVPAVVEGMGELLRRTLGPSIRIEIETAAEQPEIDVDRSEFELALLNLAINARDAMPEGGVLRLETDTRLIDGDATLPAGRYLRLRVSDTGTGMDAETERRAMEPFFTTKEPGRGTGLGLAMVHGLAAQSRGRVSLSSEPGRGTTVELLFPAAEGTTPAAPEPAVPAGAPDPRRGLDVLVVDDDTLVRMGTAGMVEDLEHRAIEAASGQQALALLRDGADIDVVLTDHAMPGITGLELAAVLAEERPDLPVILATGYADASAAALADGRITARLDKPFGTRQLAAALETAARQRSSATA